MPGTENDIEEPITTAPPEVEKIIREVIRVEKEHLHADRPKVKALRMRCDEATVDQAVQFPAVLGRGGD